MFDDRFDAVDQGHCAIAITLCTYNLPPKNIIIPTKSKSKTRYKRNRIDANE